MIWVSHVYMINKTLLVLIPQVKKYIYANQFKLMSLFNVIFKIITKSMANRLKHILLDLIYESQSVFVQGRLIKDKVLIAYECFPT